MDDSLFISRIKHSRPARRSQPQRTVIHFLVCLYQRLKLPKPLAPFHDPDNPRAGLKKGVWGESRLTFESIVEEVRRFVARMPPVDSTTGSVCCLWSFSALGDQRAEMLPVERPPALAVGGRCMMRLTRILMFPFFSLSIMDQRPLHRGAFQNAQRTSLETCAGYTCLTGQST